MSMHRDCRIFNTDHILTNAIDQFTKLIWRSVSHLTKIDVRGDNQAHDQSIVDRCPSREDNHMPSFVACFLLTVSGTLIVVAPAAMARE